MNPQVRLEQLKRDARQLSKELGIKHGQAIELLAHRAGYRTYASMRAALLGDSK